MAPLAYLNSTPQKILHISICDLVHEKISKLVCQFLINAENIETANIGIDNNISADIVVMTVIIH